MPRLEDIYNPPSELVLGTRLNTRVPETDQKRQRIEVVEILRRLRNQPGVILADEVGMGKTFVALSIAYSVALRSTLGPVIVMVPANLVNKWEQDLKTFCELYLENKHVVKKDGATRAMLVDKNAVRYGAAHHSIDLMKMLDDPSRERCHLIFLAHGAMGRSQTDKWIRLALIAECLRRHARGGASHLIQVKKYIHRFLGELLWAIGEERANEWGEDLWLELIRTDPTLWKDLYNNAVQDEKRRLTDDPVPKAIIRALNRSDRKNRLNLKKLSEALEQMPVRARGGDTRVSERLNNARNALRDIEKDLWKILLHQTHWRSPLLVMDEAHHLKNPGTTLARQLQSPDLEKDLRTGDGAMAKAFDRMLFLTATPFQLGHNELVRVLERFGDIRWDEDNLGSIKTFQQRLYDLGNHLTASQRSAIALQKSWSRLRPEDCVCEVETWWKNLFQTPRKLMSNHQRAVLEAYDAAKSCRESAEKALRPWIVRYNKGEFWVDTLTIRRRQILSGAAMVKQDDSGGLLIPPQQLLPFFLAARSAVKPGQDLLGEALCSSYEAFRFTRKNQNTGKDEQSEETPDALLDLAHAGWYLKQFDSALERCSGSTHPKMFATVRKVVDLWENGEKVLVFAFYRQTCRALRRHISAEIGKRSLHVGQKRLHAAGESNSPEDVRRLIDRIQNRFFDDSKAPGRKAVDAALNKIIRAKNKHFDFSESQKEILLEVMRSFLRVWTTIVRCFPIGELDAISPVEMIQRALSCRDSSRVSWKNKFDLFISFLIEQCSSNEERELFLDAVQHTKTGGIRIEGDEDDNPDGRGTVTLANVQVATGTTSRDVRARLMRAFNTPFFPDILVCSEVMGEGVDLQRFCRHVVHHDLDWNPSCIEQRTGRIDRLGCKAEGRHSIVVCLPYLAGTADERQYKVMSDREQWFRVVMGQDEVARLITPDSTSTIPLPQTISDGLSFKLDLRSKI